VQVLEISRRILGDEHPSTSVSAWNLFSTLREMDDQTNAMAVLKNDLLWLMDRDPATLGADQQQIREMRHFPHSSRNATVRQKLD